jgi:hypothetical protein
MFNTQLQTLSAVDKNRNYQMSMYTVSCEMRALKSVKSSLGSKIGKLIQNLHKLL